MSSTMTLLNKIRELAILIRIQQLGTSVTAIIGALSVRGMNLELSNVFLLFFICLIVNVGGQVYNDLCDLKIDKLSKELNQRPLVKGTISIKSAKTIILLCLIMVLTLIFYFYPSVYAISIIVLSFLFGTLYNIYSKKIPGSDLFLSASMALFFLFGAIVVTPNFEGFQDINIFTWILFTLIFIHVFLMDALGGGLKDAENDRKAGAKTLAVYLGVTTDKILFIPLIYKIIIMSFEISTIIFTASLFIIFNMDFSTIQLILIILLIIGMVTSTLRLLQMKEFDRKKIKYINRNHELFGFILVPMILFNSIGFFWFLFLILLPISWFIIFNYILYRDSWRKPKTF